MAAPASAGSGWPLYRQVCDETDYPNKHGRAMTANIGARLYGAAQQQLVVDFLKDEPASAGVTRDFVTKQVAQDAITHAFIAVDCQVQEQGMDPTVGAHIAGLLLVARQYIDPLAPGLAADGVTDRLSEDLNTIVDSIHLGHLDAFTW